MIPSALFAAASVGFVVGLTFAPGPWAVPVYAAGVAALLIWNFWLTYSRQRFREMATAKAEQLAADLVRNNANQVERQIRDRGVRRLHSVNTTTPAA
ncbi:MAG TPA: hypothetical protein VEL28_05280 [Candidatus Binatia bacterium]|nr:hypothetical protein [Candidatus Binatia bacterium]